MKIAWKKLKQGDLLVIDWIDITSVDGWIEPVDADNKQPCAVVSVGWFLNDNDNCLRLSNTVSDDSYNVLVIPKGVVQKVQVVKYDRE